MKLDIGEFY